MSNGSIYSQEKDGHNPALDGVRGVAILWVMMYHWMCDAAAYVPHAFPFNILWKVAWWGNRGVDLFFVLSGFLITGILLDNRGHKHYFRNFYMRRVLRIFPLYFGALIIFAGIFSQLFDKYIPGYLGDPSVRSWIWFYGTNVVQFIRNDWTFGNLTHFWSLAVEEQYYLIWPMVVYCLSRRWLSGVCFLVVAIFLIARICFFLATKVHQYPEVALSVCRPDGLALGALAAIIARSPRLNLLSTPLKILCLISGITMCVILHTVPKVNAADFTPVVIPVVADTFFACLILLVVQSRNSMMTQFFKNRILIYFGIYSYGLYVIHGLLRPPILSPEQLVSIIGSRLGGIVVYTLLCFGLSMLLALASFHLYEKKFLALKRFFPVTSGG